MASKEAIEAGQGVVKLGVEKSALEKGLADAKKDVQDFGKTIASIGGAIAAAGASLTAPFLYGLTVTAEWADSIKSASRMTSMSFAEVQDAAAGLRIGIDELPMMTRKMDQFHQHVAQGSATASAAMLAMGLQLGDLTNATEAEKLNQLAAGIAGITDNALRSATAIQVFGRQALSMNFSGGATGVNARAARNRELGGVLSDADMAIMKAYGEATKEVGIVTKGIWGQLGTIAAPMMTVVAEKTRDILIDVRKWIDANKPILTSIFNIGFLLVKVGAAIAAVGGAAYGLGVAFGVVNSILAGIGATIAFIASPIGLIIAGIAIAGLAAYVFSDQLNEIGISLSSWGPILSEFGTLAMQVFGGISAAISGGEMGLAFDILIGGMQIAWLRFKNWLVDFWYSLAFLYADSFGSAHNSIVAGAMRIWRAIGDVIATVIESFVTGINMWIEGVNRMINLLPRSLIDQLGLGVGIQQIQGPNRENMNAGFDRIEAGAQVDATAVQTAQAAAAGRGRGEVAAVQAQLDFDANMAEMARGMAEAARFYATDAAGGRGTSTEMAGSVFGTFSGAALAGFGASTNPVVDAMEASDRTRAAEAAAIVAAILAIPGAVLP